MLTHPRNTRCCWCVLINNPRSLLSWRAAAEAYLGIGGQLLNQLQCDDGAVLSEQLLAQVAAAREDLEQADAAYNTALDKLEVRPSVLMLAYDGLCLKVQIGKPVIKHCCSVCAEHRPQQHTAQDTAECMPVMRHVIAGGGCSRTLPQPAAAAAGDQLAAGVWPGCAAHGACVGGGVGAAFKRSAMAAASRRLCAAVVNGQSGSSQQIRCASTVYTCLLSPTCTVLPLLLLAHHPVLLCHPSSSQAVCHSWSSCCRKWHTATSWPRTPQH